MYIPQKIKVGYQNRKDTYTGKLAYIVYCDEKDQLRKEWSWNSWRDSEIDPSDFINEPTSGFVLNKKVGDYHYGHSWESRKSYIRIYDPRGFEFEITPENLIYILENCNSMVGKGLEGDFVCEWIGGTTIEVIFKDGNNFYMTTFDENDVVPWKDIDVVEATEVEYKEVTEMQWIVKE